MSEARILFVDDEQAILDGLRDLLRKERRRWDMVFVTGGPEALDALARQPFDVVVSDIRMPVMDGAQLLTRIKTDHPSVARIVLTGHADRDAVLRALPVAHQFLTKPCESGALRVAIERTQALHALLASDEIRGVVGRLVSLPSVPQTYLALTEAARDASTGIADLTAIVERDPAMGTKVLQLVNSAYFGGFQRIASIRQAVLYLGIELLKGLALSGNVFATGDLASAGFSLADLQTRSLRRACLARRFVDDPRQAEEAFTAALVCDVGQIIMAMCVRTDYRDIRQAAQRSQRPLHAVELETLGVTHAEIGAHLLGVWGLPFSIIESVAYHHRPGALADGPCEILAAVHAADAFIEAAPGGPIDVDPAFVERMALGDRLARWRRIADKGLHAV
jgi:HD-like signal output (HDOD) protein/CheY-like chemotaxis protein